MPDEMIPDYLGSAHKLVSSAFPNGIPEDDYFPLLAILAEEMSEECLVNLMGYFLPNFGTYIRL